MQYGSFSDGGKIVGAHRYAYERHVAKIPDGLHVLHKCDNPLCVNPDHLFLGTNQDNVDDKMRKGRLDRRDNEHNARCKISNEQVREIRESGESGVVLGKRYGVSRNQISYIKRGLNRVGC